MTEQDILSLMDLSEENLLWLVQGLVSGSLYLLGEFFEEAMEDGLSEGEDSEVLAY
jgi:hypothetical protein